MFACHSVELTGSLLGNEQRRSDDIGCDGDVHDEKEEMRMIEDGPAWKRSRSAAVRLQNRERNWRLTWVWYVAVTTRLDEGGVSAALFAAVCQSRMNTLVLSQK